MKVAFLGGGTGGHLAPAIGVAEELRARGAEVVFLVAGREVEQQMLGPRHLNTVSLFGGGSRPSPARVDRWWSAGQNLRQALREHDPDAVVTTGGWVSAPALLTGLGGRPSLLIEPNAVPGKVCRLLANRVDQTCTAREGIPLSGRLGQVVTGVPGLPLGSWTTASARAHLGLDPDRHTLLVLGGSQGARDLAGLLPSARRVLANDERPWQVLHITGPAGREDQPPTEGVVPVRRLAFLSEMGAAWAAADVALCRAGSGTVAELSLTGTPAVFVPYPHHADHHQEANGQALVHAGAAFMVPRSDPLGRATAVELLAKALGQLEQMSAAARALARPDAARRVAELVEQAAGRRRRP